MVTRYYGALDGNVVKFVVIRDEVDIGPPSPSAGNPFGYTYVLLDGPVDWSAKPSESSELLRQTDGTLLWVEVATLASLQADAIAQTYPDVDAVYEAAIGRRATEYAEAEVDARAFAADAYTVDTTPYVTGFALRNPTGVAQTNEWAARQIIGRADAFKQAQLAMRNTRFDRQADMRAATTYAELQAAVSAWDGFIAALRSQLGI
jgi:hypothetical protein